MTDVICTRAALHDNNTLQTEQYAKIISLFQAVEKLAGESSTVKQLCRLGVEIADEGNSNSTLASETLANALFGDEAVA